MIRGVEEGARGTRSVSCEAPKLRQAHGQVATSVYEVAVSVHKALLAALSRQRTQADWPPSEAEWWWWRKPRGSRLDEAEVQAAEKRSSANARESHTGYTSYRTHANVPPMHGQGRIRACAPGSTDQGSAQGRAGTNGDASLRSRLRARRGPKADG